MNALEIEHLHIRYGHTPVVEDVSLTVGAGRTVGLVGESGSGKSTIAAAVVGLVQPAQGDIRIDGVSAIGRTAAARRSRRQVQLVFQDPFSALDPRMPVGDSIAEALRATGRRWSKPARIARVRELLTQVHLDPDRAGERPGAFSGGQRQRVTIARALAGEPTLLVADEVTSALDVSVQGAILNLLRELQAELGLSMLFITHNLAVVRYISDEICVLRGGRLIESGPTESLTETPGDPYTTELLESVPVLGERMEL
ncbi:ABC transporter ATP-binding protein [Microbacterium horticulturae]|uniref:ABC transporter ATP-binding protein n=1 Tax=Microbacterium horticulturae TaxID=3028316 RepID=A0ABY8BXT4_9MICO|nr:ABC transporter ATP-binding protein [Microbacterium sp. KACC 23027]WEG08697.1 ABC transporter ATP-binding protein [Microbacterium sp. KACC 23027]